jgi:aconitate hydratase 2/2-methylisocitrate dehydratase
MFKGVARTGYENILYLERPGCNLCMGNQEKQPGDSDGNPTRLSKEELLKIQRVKKENPCFINTSCGISTILGRTPTIEEYKAAVKGINLTQFAPLTNYWQISKIVKIISSKSLSV